MPDSLNIISREYLTIYQQSWNNGIKEAIDRIAQAAPFSAEDFEYYVVASSLFSSKIEGNSLDFNSFFRNRNKNSYPKAKEVKEIENLASGYNHASENAFNESNFLKAHSLLSKTLLPAKERGKYLTDQVGIRDSASGRPVYMAVEAEFVGEFMAKLFSDINILMASDLELSETFYYASIIHLWIGMIHPFGDGNGRAARLAEKWFLAAKIGTPAWAITSEKHYWEHRPDYYQNIALGFNFYTLHWDRCIPFLKMLPEAILS